MLAGLVTIALPRIALTLSIPPSLLLWPASITALTCGCTLILSGAVADVVGHRLMYLLGTFLQAVFTMACGLSKTTAQLVVFRGLSGVASAFVLPSAVGLVMGGLKEGRGRNMAFACMGGGQALGFAVGLVVGGVLVDGEAGWRGGFWVCAGINAVVLGVVVWGLPRVDAAEQGQAMGSWWPRLGKEIDWVGAGCLSAALGGLSYVFAVVTGSVASIKQGSTVGVLVGSVVLIGVFVWWMHRQEKLGQPAIIPNSIWKNRVFTSICVDVFLLWGAFNSVETLLTFYFQDVQMLSATQTSLRFLPLPIVGVCLNVFIGAVIHRLKANWAIIIGAMISAVSPILAGVMEPTDLYWEYALPAIMLTAVGCDVLFTASNLVITNAFPAKTQALAGGVFNSVAQIGKSVGLAMSAVIANSISAPLEGGDKPHTLVLLEGYRGAWWFCLASCLAVVVISAAGLRNIGKLGVKRD